MYTLLLDETKKEHNQSDVDGRCCDKVSLRVHRMRVDAVDESAITTVYFS